MHYLQTTSPPPLKIGRWGMAALSKHKVITSIIAYLLPSVPLWYICLLRNTQTFHPDNVNMYKTQGRLELQHRYIQHGSEARHHLELLAHSFTGAVIHLDLKLVWETRTVNKISKQKPWIKLSCCLRLFSNDLRILNTENMHSHF